MSDGIAKYTRHINHCGERYSSVAGEWIVTDGPCTCGLNEALASRDAEIGRLREALQRIATGNRRYLANRVDSARLANGIAVIEVCAELAEAALTPPSQAPEARRDVGGEKL